MPALDRCRRTSTTNLGSRLPADWIRPHFFFCAISSIEPIHGIPMDYQIVTGRLGKTKGKAKHFLQGIIGAIGVLRLPAMIGGYVAYVRFSNVHGDQKVKLAFEHAGAENDPLFEIEANFPSQSDPLGVYTLVIPVPPFV